MSSFEATRAAARRSRGATAGVSERLRAGAEQQANMMRNARAQQEAQANRAQNRMSNDQRETARIQAQSTIQSGEAQARAKMAIGELMNNLGTAFVATTQKVMNANADANMAQHKLDVQKQARRAVAAADSGQSVPADVYHLAAKDAYTERAASLQAHRDAVTLATELDGIEDPEGVWNHVHETLARNIEGMEDPAYREYYANFLRTKGDEMAGKREASLIKAASVAQYQTAIGSVVVEVAEGSIQDGETLDQRIESAMLAAPKGFKKDFRKDLAASLIKQAAETGTLHKVVPMLSQTEILQRNPILLAEASGAIYRENKAIHKATVDAKTTEINTVLSTVLGDKGASVADIESAFAAIGMFGTIEGVSTVDSGLSMSKRINEVIPQLQQKYALAQRYQQWQAAGGTFDEAFKPFVNKEINQATTTGDWGRVQRLMTDTGHVPQLLLENIHGVFKGVDGRIDGNAFARHAPAVGAILAADQQSNGALLAGLDDQKAAFLLGEIAQKVDEGFGIEPAVEWMVGQYPPDVMTRIGEFDVEKALKDKNYDVALSRKVGEVVRDAGGWTSWLPFSGDELDVEGLEGVDVGRMTEDVKRRVAILSKGIDDGKLNEHLEQALVDVSKRYAANAVPLPTIEGTKASHIPNRAMRNDLKAGIRLPNGETMSAEQVVSSHFKMASAVLQDPAFAEFVAEDSDVSPEQFGLTTAFRPAQVNGKLVLKARVGLKDTPPFDSYGYTVDQSDKVNAMNTRLQELGSAVQWELDSVTGSYALTFTWDRDKLAADGEEALKFQQQVDMISKDIAATQGEAAAYSYRDAASRADPINGPSALDIAAMMPGGQKYEVETAQSSFVETAQAGDPEVAQAGVPEVAQPSPYASWDKSFQTNQEVNEVAKKASLQSALYKSMQQLQESGVISKSWGSTRPIPEVGTQEEYMDALRSAIEDYQMNENAGLPADPIDTPYDETYLAKRREVIQAHEGFRSKIYKDHKGITTVGVGINLQAPDTKKFIEDAGWDYPALLSGAKEFSKAQLDVLYDFKVKEAEKFVSTVIKVPLTSNQRQSLVSLAYNNPSLIGPNLRYFVNNKDWKNAEEEIRRRSNKNKHGGIQNRRNTEADLFAMDTHKPSDHHFFLA